MHLQDFTGSGCRLRRMIKIGKLYISLWTVVLILFCAFCGALWWLLLSYAALCVHEVAHCIAAKWLKIASDGVYLQPFGITLRLRDNRITEPFCEAVLCLVGPLANLCFAAGLYFTCDLSNVYVHYLYISNLSIGSVNLLPILPLDGGRILKAYLTAKLGLIRAVRISEFVTYIFVLGVGLFSLCALWTLRFNVSWMILVSFLLFNMSLEKKNNAYLIMRQISEYKRKLTATKVMRVHHLAAQKDAPAKQLAEHFSYDKYHMVHLFDAEQKHCGSLTETQILDAMIEQGRNVALCDVRVSIS